MDRIISCLAGVMLGVLLLTIVIKGCLVTFPDWMVLQGNTRPVLVENKFYKLVIDSAATDSLHNWRSK